MLVLDVSECPDCMRRGRQGDKRRHEGAGLPRKRAKDEQVKDGRK